eukprot:gb/GECG01004977.1/.p1 GENE.gb/GECG01004977.1/~~gb/GECG01004977.1/.p1  ORF type:complete len:106 (+),score=7.18 gb/GECG01004977.1/:1-318(+)
MRIKNANTTEIGIFQRTGFPGPYRHQKRASYPIESGRAPGGQGSLYRVPQSKTTKRVTEQARLHHEEVNDMLHTLWFRFNTKEQQQHYYSEEHGHLFDTSIQSQG